MKIKAKILAVFLLCMMIPQICLAVPDKLWEDDGTLDRIYGKNSDDREVGSDILQDLLRALGILDEELFDGTKKADFHDFVKATAVISGRNFDGADDEQLLEELFEAGIVNFSVKKNSISFQEALYTAVKLTGYTQNAEYGGGYPVGYEKTASENGLLFGLLYERDKNITKGELSQLLYNILTADSLEIKLSGADTVYDTATVPTILERKFDTVIVKGVMNRVDETSIYESGFLGEGFVEIDRMKCKIMGQKDYDALLGKSVNAFVMDNDGEKELLCADERPGKNETAEFLGSDIDSITEGQIRAYVDGKEKKYKIKQDTKIVYNGVYAGNASVNLMKKYMEDDAQISVVENDGDGYIDVLIVWKYEHFTALYDAGSTARVKFKDAMTFRGDESFVAKTEDDDIVRVFMNGEKKDYTAIKKGNVLSIAKSVNTYGKTLTKIVLCDKTMSGTINAVGEDDNGKPTFEIDGTSYEVTKNYLDACGWPNGTVRDDVLVPKLGLSAVYSLTFDGKIADISTDSGLMYGVFLTARIYDDDGDDNPEIALKIFTQDAKMSEIYLEEYVTLYSESNPKGKKMERKYIPTEIKNSVSGSDPRTPIAYTLKGSGRIKALYLVYDNIDGTIGSIDYPLTYDYYGEGYSQSRYYHGMMVMKYRMGDNMKLFLLPKEEDKDDDSQYKVVAPGFYGIDHNYYGIKLYGIDKYYTANVGTVTDDGVTFENSSPAVVEKVTASVNNDDETVYTISYYMDSKKVAATTAKPGMKSTKQEDWAEGLAPEQLKFGDIIHFRTANGKIDHFRVLIHDIKNTEFFMKQSDGTTITEENEPTGFVVMYGKVEAVNDDVIIINTASVGTNSAAHRLVDPAVYLIEDKKIEPVTVAEIKTGDTIVARKGYQGILEIYIYR